jgi:Fic family protein
VPEANKRQGSSGRPARATVYRRLADEVEALRQRPGGLPSPAAATVIWRRLSLEEAHHSTAIEGNTLVLAQVAELLQEGRAVGNRELREYLEARGYATAADWVYADFEQVHPLPVRVAGAPRR